MKRTYFDTPVLFLQFSLCSCIHSVKILIMHVVMREGNMQNRGKGSLSLERITSWHEKEAYCHAYSTRVPVACLGVIAVSQESLAVWPVDYNLN